MLLEEGILSELWARLSRSLEVDAYRVIKMMIITKLQINEGYFLYFGLSILLKQIRKGLEISRAMCLSQEHRCMALITALAKVHEQVKAPSQSQIALNPCPKDLASSQQYHKYLAWSLN